MANLNFTRSIGGNSLGRASVSFGSSSMSGHVTPVFGQRTPSERRTLPTMGNSNQVGNMNALGNYSFNSVFGSGDSNTPSLLDLSEFPSLTNNRGGGGSASTDGTHASLSAPGPMPGAKPYVGMVKQPTSEASEFTMSSEDFPALPGTQTATATTTGAATGVRDGASPSGAGGGGGGGPGGGGQQPSGGVNTTSGMGGDKQRQQGQGDAGATNVSGGAGTPGRDTTGQGQQQGQANSQTQDKNGNTKGIQTLPDGRVTNIPASMVSDQFGIVGLLTFIRAAETDPNLVSLALGQDLTALGLNLNSADNLYPTFGGPWAEHPLRPQDVDYHVPPEYLINHNIREKLASMKLSRYKDDLLFFMFYNSVGDVLQIAAASELYSREWRYHIEEKVWITQVPGMVLIEKTATYERGTYYFFDAQNWRKVAKEFHLDYSKLEGRPVMNQNLHLSS